MPIPSINPRPRQTPGCLQVKSPGIIRGCSQTAADYPKSLLRRIKRQVAAREHAFFAVSNPGLENLCLGQIRRLLPAARAARVTGGIEFSGRLTDCYLVNLHCSFAVRVLMRIKAFKATGFSVLEKKLSAIAWELYLPPAAAFKVKASCHKSRLYHSEAVAGRIGESIASRIGSPSDPRAPAVLTVYARLDRDRLTLSLDSSGEPLFKRGLKRHAAAAPLRETTAAAVLALAGWRPGTTLVDPMCGSGTFSLEAAMASKNIPPGWYREFAFFHWPAFRPRQWNHLRKKSLQSRVQFPRPIIHASDLDPRLVEHLAESLALHGLDDAVSVRQADFFRLKPPSKWGWLVINPPYGRRLGRQENLEKLYERMRKYIRNHWTGWHLALLTSRQGVKFFKKRTFSQHKIFHGGLQTVLVHGRIA